ncbi:MAG TPA: c-type cytochrome domain-containing protein, partial [Pirellulales bacterium]|nr:c-type cytochrome domain-containing protein [Pirellulales bacterium]
MRRLAIWTLFCVPLLSAVAAGGEVDQRDQADFFERKVRPLLVEKCQKCHGAEKSRGNLRLRSRDEVLKGGDSGPAAIPGKPGESLLIRAVGYLDEPRMPPDGKLSENEIDVLKRWVALGIPWPDAGRELLQPSAGPTGRTAEQLRWWAFQPLRVVAPSLDAKNEQPRHP